LRDNISAIDPKEKTISMEEKLSGYFNKMDKFTFVRFLFKIMKEKIKLLWFLVKI
jgi:hypothetical protein